jgi:hypothetical protein
MTSLKAATVRLDALARADLDDMKRFSGIKTDSKAFVYAVHHHIGDRNQIKNLERENNELEQEVKRLNQLIDHARSSALSFIQDISQEDMF